MAGHVGILHDQPTWVVHAGYRHAVFIATLPEANRVRTEWGLGIAETPELGAYRGNFVDFANFFSNDMHGDEIVHRRIKTGEVFDLASSAYLGLCQAAHRAEATADAAALADSDDDADDDGAPPPPPRQQRASEATSSELSKPGRGVGRPGAGPSSLAPGPEPPPNAATSAADTPAATPARFMRSGAVGKPRTNVVTSLCAAVSQVATSAAIVVTGASASHAPDLAVASRRRPGARPAAGRGG